MNSDIFRKNGHKIIDILADYLGFAESDTLKTALPNINPQEMLDKWDGDFSALPNGDFFKIINGIIEDSNHLHNRRYIGHQVTSPLPQAALCDLIGRILNNASTIFEMGPVNVILEKRLIEWMSKLIGFDEKADGIFTSGGTIGNLTGLLAARQNVMDYDVWKTGINSGNPYVILSTGESHYSINRAACIMGLGEDSIIHIPTDNNFKMDLSALKKRYNEITESGKKILAVVGNACSTATGVYDNLEAIGLFCRENNLWFHIDGAHGASALLSDKYKYLLKGIHLADSVVWDAHKMMLMPALITAVIFRNGKHSFDSLSQKASYLFEKEAHEEWFNYAQRTVECTKTMMGMKLYVSLKTCGINFFSDYIDKMYDLARDFTDLIEKSGNFEIPIYPESNIVCFRYIGKETKNINFLQKEIRKKILESERFYIVQTQLGDKFYLRCTIINPATTLKDLSDLLDFIRDICIKIHI